MKKSGIISFLRGVLVLLSLLNLGFLLMSILMVKPLAIGLSISFFVLVAVFQNYHQIVESESSLVLEKEKNNAY
ncbi:hypothetical protein [Pedobacter gandavensis]|uniref:hypothetical protein n=1 Tax=Pedobacter gandavensis TaxID=2679963 RepID=UPI00293132F7|nr:hypothetical protein [Pedobacter gandavensis]